MNMYKGNMWKNGEKIHLSYLLDKIPDNKWDWYLYEIDAVGIAPRDMSMLDFEQQALSCDTGLKLTWDEVKSFANTLDDINTFFLAALMMPMQHSVIGNGDSSYCFASIRVIDSTSWEIQLIKE